MSFRKLLIGVVAVSILGAPPLGAQPSTGPASRPAARAIDPLRAAIIELTREANTAAQRRQPFPRQEPDYFVGKDVTIDEVALLKALPRQIVRDPRGDAYIKLQLLSGIQKFDQTNAKLAISAFIAAPPLLPIPSGQRDMQPFDRKAQQARNADDVTRVNDELDAWRKEYADQNDIILAYRDRLLDRIVVDDALKPKLLQARIEELSQRATAGFDIWAEQSSLFTEVLNFAAIAPPSQVADMRSFLAEYAKRSPPDVLDKLVWSNARQSSYWRRRKAGFDAKKLTSVIESLKAIEARR